MATLSNFLVPINPVSIDAVKGKLLEVAPQTGYPIEIQVGGGTYTETRLYDANANIGTFRAAAERALTGGDTNLANAINNMRIKLEQRDRWLDPTGSGNVRIAAGYGGAAPTALGDFAKSGADLNLTNSIDNSDFGVMAQQPLNPSFPSLPNTGIGPNALLALLMSGMQQPQQNPYANLNNFGQLSNPYGNLGNCIPQPTNCAPNYNTRGHHGRRGLGHWMKRQCGNGINIINNFFGSNALSRLGGAFPYTTSAIPQPNIQYPGAAPTGFMGW